MEKSEHTRPILHQDWGQGVSNYKGNGREGMAAKQIMGDMGTLFSSLLKGDEGSWHHHEKRQHSEAAFERDEY